jgi:hypothetical protein
MKLGKRSSKRTKRGNFARTFVAATYRLEAVLVLGLVLTDPRQRPPRQ